jgi:hypothetical protein
MDPDDLMTDVAGNAARTNQVVESGSADSDF